MSMTDPIADMLTRIRNAAAVNKTTVEVPYSKVKESVAKVLVDEGYVAKATKKDHHLTLELAQDGNKIKLNGIDRSSKPGRRWYLGADELPKVREGIGIAIVSTSRGVMTAKEARKKKLGGEVMAKVY
ncbi:30S ribosomal protein S8 [Patescibacteria group bacterium]|nr:30S ribosomal protein S8 [Patescibacteria group bacterium]